MIPIAIAALLSQGLSLVANAAMAKGTEWVEEKTGVKLGPQPTPEELTKLKQFELENETELRALQVKDNQIGLEYFQTEMADKNSARSREVEMAKVSTKPWYVPSITDILAFTVVVGGGWLFQVTTEAETRFALIGIITMVLTYYFGGVSSQHGVGKIMADANKERR
jgi:hypothetical protein